jgi:hypothetical protein
MSTNPPGEEYPHHGTCDRCAEGNKPLREADPDTEAWVCRECSDLLEQAQEAATAALLRWRGVSVAEQARRCIAAYFQVLDSGEKETP